MRCVSPKVASIYAVFSAGEIYERGAVFVKRGIGFDVSRHCFQPFGGAGSRVVFKKNEFLKINVLKFYCRLFCS